MKKGLQNLKEFTNSDYNSENENAFMDSTMKVINDRNLRLRYTEKLEKELNVTRGGNQQKSKANYSKLFVALALFALSILAFLYWNAGKKQDIASNQQVATVVSSYYEDLDLATRGEMSVIETIAAITNAYSEKDFKSVISAYNGMADKRLLSNKFLYAAGLSFAIEGDLNQSEIVFRSLLETPESDYSFHQESRWKLVNVLVDNNKVEAAAKVISMMKEGDYKYKEAQNLLGK